MITSSRLAIQKVRQMTDKQVQASCDLLQITVTAQI